LIDVLCFVPDNYTLFGFFRFEITEITVREICFFGDFCLKDTDIYDGTEYEESGGGVFIDEPAIFEIRARHKVGDGDWDDMIGTDFNNVGWLGVGKPLCIQYPDYDAEVDSYEFELYLWAMGPTDMQWVYIYTFEWDDIFEVTYPPGDDGVYEFVVGNCVASETDMLFPPYTNLPTSVTMSLAGNGWNRYTPPATGDAYYFNVTLTDFSPPGTYDIPGAPTVLEGWCGDRTQDINYTTYNNTLVFSSLDPASLMPDKPWGLDDDKLLQLNYLANHFLQNGIDPYGPLAPASGDYPGDGTTIQQAIWGVTNNGAGYFPPTQSLALDMSTAALQPSNYENYKILPGGSMFVLFFAPDGNGGYVMQLVLVLVDP
jgi:hypothetical protein